MMFIIWLLNKLQISEEVKFLLVIRLEGIEMNISTFCFDTKQVAINILNTLVSAGILVMVEISEHNVAINNVI